ncbi:sugar transporter, putative [Ricinus communis]|uniref:Sugar transporter, putative n=1 Tax=Ricinus communis TaxID=3988 RepID=B9RJJ4_RICCO|nr:sugar transporter, putative [Ricinus communis]|eukprot:XP_002513913.1 sugar transport protein 5 [Ricinus communis]
MAGFASSLLASRLIAALGRKNIIVLGGCSFLAGAAINGAATNITMLILGRMLLGFGVGFTNQATPVYLSEVAPAKWRGAFNTGFQFFIGTGVLIAGCINYASAKLSWGWRLCLGLAIVPATTMVIGGLIISDTPSSLVERGKIEKARKALIKIRGNDSNIDAELTDLTKNSDAAKASQEPFKTVFERQYRPHLVMAIAIPFFQQVTGINIIAFYAPVLFQSIGFGNDPALMAAIILGLVTLASIMVSTGVVDRFGRRFLFIVGGIQMFICQVAIALVLAATVGVSGTNPISRSYALLLLFLMCVYTAGFGWSWGPLSWLIPSEIFPVKLRPTGQSISVGVHFAVTFVLSQTFLAMLCHFRYGIFIFYAVWIAIMTIFIALFLPETKGIPMDSINGLWESHWYWRRFAQGKLPKKNPLNAL